MHVASSQGGETLTEAERDLKELKESLKDTQPMGALVDRCKTLDQVRLPRSSLNNTFLGLRILDLKAPNLELEAFTFITWLEDGFVA